MKKFISKFAVTALLVMPLAGAMPFVVSAAVGGPVCNVPADYATIQGAVSDAGCTTINVAAGTYAEQVMVNRSVVINGANVGVAGNGVRGAESIVDGSNTSTPFVITANDVTIDGFTVQNGSNGSLFSGIWSQTGTMNSKIMNNIVTNNDIGVWAQCAGNCLIQNNLFDGNNQAGPDPAGISADTTTGLTVDKNEFKNHTAGNPILFQAVAAGAHNNLVVSNNSFHDNTNSNVYSIGVTGGTFTGNTVAVAAGATGFSFSGADSNISVTMNKITNGARGVRVEDAGFGLGANTGIVVNRNDVSSNTEYGVGNITPTTALVDGTCNWWGATNGPGPVGTGSGSPVSTNVSFVSWLTSSDLTSACNGSPVVATLSAEDFGVVNYDTGLGFLKGYSAGFGLTDATFAGSSVVMQLFNGTTLLQTNTSTPKVGATITGVQISSPFDVSGNFDYATDGYWTNVRQTQFGQSLAANRVVATVTLADGTVLTAENNNVTGDPTTIFAPVLTSVTIAPVTATIGVMKKKDGKDDDNKDKDGKEGDDKNGNVANTVQLTATDFDQSGAVFSGATTTFSSSNPAVATVDSATGLVTGVSAGTATITATSVSGSVTVTGTSVITVVKGGNGKKDDGDKGNGKDGDKKPPVVTPPPGNDEKEKN